MKGTRFVAFKHGAMIAAQREDLKTSLAANRISCESSKRSSSACDRGVRVEAKVSGLAGIAREEEMACLRICAASGMEGSSCDHGSSQAMPIRHADHHIKSLHHVQTGDREGEAKG
eukprot:2687105-Pleurochrysis_carterae.AAC.8